MLRWLDQKSAKRWRLEFQKCFRCCFIDVWPRCRSLSWFSSSWKTDGGCLFFPGGVFPNLTRIRHQGGFSVYDFRVRGWHRWGEGELGKTPESANYYRVESRVHYAYRMPALPLISRCQSCDRCVWPALSWCESPLSNQPVPNLPSLGSWQAWFA